MRYILFLVFLLSTFTYAEETTELLVKFKSNDFHEQLITIHELSSSNSNIISANKVFEEILSLSERINLLEDLKRRSKKQKKNFIKRQIKKLEKLERKIQRKARKENLPKPIISKWYKLLVLSSNVNLTKQALQNDLRVEAVSENVEVTLADYPYTLPNDKFIDSNLDNLWDKNNISPETQIDMYGLEMIKANKAWRYTTGEDVIVAVIDTGVDHTHPDIQANIHINTAEIPDNNIDDDGNGYVDDYYGYNFLDDNSNAMDLDYHGTHVAGTIAAVANNTIGIAGVAPNAKIMNLKGLHNTGEIEGLALAIRYAADNGADIINNSWGGPGVSPMIEDALAYAKSQGVVSIAAAGNSSEDAADYFPSSSPNSIAVGAVDANGELADFSNYGEIVKVLAPGVLIQSLECSELYNIRGPLSRFGERAYIRSSGTSMAAPHVAGLAALMIAKYPDLSVDEVKNKIISSRRNLPASSQLPDAGIINAENAVLNDEINFLEPINNELLSDSIQIKLEAPTNTERINLYLNGNSIATVFDYPYKHTLDTNLYSNGSYELRADLIVQDEIIKSASVNVFIENNLDINIRSHREKDEVNGIITILGNILNPQTANNLLLEYASTSRQIAYGINGYFSHELNTNDLENGLQELKFKLFRNNGTSSIKKVNLIVNNRINTYYPNGNLESTKKQVYDINSLKLVSEHIDYYRNEASRHYKHVDKIYFLNSQNLRLKTDIFYNDSGQRTKNVISEYREEPYSLLLNRTYNYNPQTNQPTWWLINFFNESSNLEKTRTKDHIYHNGAIKTIRINEYDKNDNPLSVEFIHHRNDETKERSQKIVWDLFTNVVLNNNTNFDVNGKELLSETSEFENSQRVKYVRKDFINGVPTKNLVIQDQYVRANDDRKSKTIRKEFDGSWNLERMLEIKFDRIHANVERERDDYMYIAGVLRRRIIIRYDLAGNETYRREYNF